LPRKRQQQLARFVLESYLNHHELNALRLGVFLIRYHCKKHLMKQPFHKINLTFFVARIGPTSYFVAQAKANLFFSLYGNLRRKIQLKAFKATPLVYRLNILRPFSRFWIWVAVKRHILQNGLQSLTFSRLYSFFILSKTTQGNMAERSESTLCESAYKS